MEEESLRGAVKTALDSVFTKDELVVSSLKGQKKRLAKKQSGLSPRRLKFAKGKGRVLRNILSWLLCLNQLFYDIF